jgi:hypothetical protein
LSTLGKYHSIGTLGKSGFFMGWFMQAPSPFSHAWLYRKQQIGLDGVAHRFDVAGGEAQSGE